MIYHFNIKWNSNHTAFETKDLTKSIRSYGIKNFIFNLGGLCPTVDLNGIDIIVGNGPYGLNPILTFEGKITGARWNNSELKINLSNSNNLIQMTSELGFAGYQNYNNDLLFIKS